MNYLRMLKVALVWLILLLTVLSASGQSDEGVIIYTTYDAETYDPRIVMLDAGTGEPLGSAEWFENFTPFSPSPDGWRIAYSEFHDGLGASFILDFRTGEVTSLPLIVLSQPYWSPDGRYIAYSIPLDSTLFPAVALYDTTTGETQTLTDLLESSAWLAWSPNSREIAVNARMDDRIGIMVVDIATGEIRRLTDDAGYTDFLLWSPSGDTIADVAHLEDDGSQIRIINAETGEEKLNAVVEGDVYYPTWSPDGAHIAYSAFHSSEQDIFMIDVETGDETPLTSDEGHEVLPAWSRDGTQLAYISDRIDGRDLMRLTLETGRVIFLRDSREDPPTLDFLWVHPS